MELALLPFVIYFTAKYAFYEPTKLVIFYLSLSTYMFGFFNVGSLIIGGMDLGYFSVNFVVFLSIFFYRGWYKIDTFPFPIFIVVAGLLLLGILGPVLREFENLIQAITSSKTFLYYAFLFYIIIRSDEIDVELIIKFMKYSGLYLAFFTIAYNISSATSVIAPPLYKSDYHGLANVVRVPQPTYMSFSLFLYYAEWQLDKISGKKMFFIFLFLALGLVLTGYTALATFSLVSFAFVYFVWGKGERDSYVFIKKTIFGLSFVILLFAGSWQLREEVIKMQEDIQSGDDAALASREKYNKFRWRAIGDSPIIGMGFIHKSASIMDEYREKHYNSFMERFDVIDSGYVDMLVRFGYLGSAVLLFTISLYLILVFKQETPNPYALAAAGHVLPYYLINYTWAVFTYPNGTIPLSIALLIIYKYRPIVKVYRNAL